MSYLFPVMEKIPFIIMWRSNFLILLTITISTSAAYSQELFPLEEPASTLPLHALVPRAFTEIYGEVGAYRNLTAVSLSYGITSNLTGRITTDISNHHDRFLPKDYVTHTHYGSQTVYYVQNVNRGYKYPYLLAGFDFYAKYKILSFDKPKEHLRFAVYSELSTAKTAHDEAEPNLLDDNSGLGFGMIATKLKNRLAYSLTLGYITPKPYEEQQDSIQRKLTYGNALNYSLSFGYLLSPKEYKSYYQTNTNLYVELIGKVYKDVKVVENGGEIVKKSIAQQGGFYLEMHPGFQRIINSQSRFDFSVGFNFIKRSYAHFYPLIQFSWQHYVYL